MAARVNALAEEEIALPYHGSLSRERRFLLEERLKAGELRALVTTSSLELGIDVGLGGPRDPAPEPQARGRGAPARRARRALARRDEPRGVRPDVPRRCDGAARDPGRDARRRRRAHDAWCRTRSTCWRSSSSPSSRANCRTGRARALFDFVRRAYPYHELTRAAFDEVLAMLSGKYPSDVAAELDARIHWDRVTDLLTPTRGARMVATISGGTIPDRGLYTVNLADKTRLGELDEEFVHESRVGDVFQLGSTTWRIRAIEHDRVIVVPAPGAPARMPFWHGEFMARSSHLTARVGELRRELDDARTLDGPGRDPAGSYHADEPTTRSLVEYVQAQRAITRIVPDETHLVLEHFRDEVGSRAHGAARAVRRTRERAVGDGARPPHARAARHRRAGADDGRRPDAAAAGHGRRAAGRRRFARSRWRKPSGWCSRRWGVVAVRRALPDERGARAAAAARQSAATHAALAAAAQGARPAAGGARVSVVPDPRRDVSRRAAGRVRHGGAARRARPDRVGGDHDPHGGDGDPVAVRGVAAVRVRDRPHVRQGCAARRGARGAAVARSRAAGRADGGRGRGRHHARGAGGAARAAARHGGGPSGARRRRAGDPRRSRGGPDARGARRAHRAAGGVAARRSARRRCSRAGG